MPAGGWPSKGRRRVLRALCAWLAASASGCGSGAAPDAGFVYAPEVLSLDPSYAVTYSGAFQLHVAGNSFSSNSVVEWDGAPLATSFVSSNDLLATVPAGDVSAPGQALVTVVNPPGADSNAVSFPVLDPNPVPSLSSVTPSSVLMGDALLTLTLTGTNFVPASVAWRDGFQFLNTRFVSATELQADINVDAAFDAVITVINPPPSGGTSEGVAFSVDAPVPVLTSLDPNSVTVGSIGLSVSLNGSGLTTDSVVLWNGTPLANVSNTSSTQFGLDLDYSLLSKAGTASVTVVTPPPGGGTSNTLTFTINPLPSGYPHVEIPQATNDLVWDSNSRLLYLSVPSTAASCGNSVAVVDPDAGVVLTCPFVGSEPNAIAVSQDGQFLYVGLDGSASMKRLTLPGLGPSLEYSLGGNSNGAFTALDVEVAPGLPHTTAVTLAQGLAGQPNGGLVIYDDSVQRPNAAPTSGAYISLQWGSDAAHLYSADRQSRNLFTFAVDAGGVTLVHAYPQAFPNFGSRIHFDPGTQLLYGDDGFVVDPTTGAPAGVFDAAGLMVPDSSLGRAFFLFSPPGVGLPGVAIQAFDLTHFTLITSVTLPNVQGNPLGFIRFGTNGLAFFTDAGFVYLLSGALVDGSDAGP
jgi:hypothetical protein